MPHCNVFTLPPRPPLFLARHRIKRMKILSQRTAADLIPANATLDDLRQIAAGCRACDLWKRGTQTVFGEGSAHAKVMFVGEQPGDREDIEGKPFVGPAGRILDEGLEAAAINRNEVYVTNVVKHFRWVAA